MRTSVFRNMIACYMAFLFLQSCAKDETKYYPDNSTPGVAVFSNTGNNVFSCLLNGVPWRTFDRKTGGWGGSSFEVRITKNYLDSVTDLLSITWEGHYVGDQYGFGDIKLFFSVSKNFSLKDFDTLQGKRLAIDGVKNYFVEEVDNQPKQGSGTIYFHEASLDSTVYGKQGKMSGLIEADFGSMKLTSGRFDHNLEGVQIFFY